MLKEFSTYEADFGDARGQESAKRAMTLAEAGTHNLIRLARQAAENQRTCQKSDPTILPPVKIVSQTVFRRFGLRHRQQFDGFLRIDGLSNFSFVKMSRTLGRVGICAIRPIDRD
ncbi:hypothetical protein Rcae01_03488 [Novipirellula caenicola]|uniref:Magnesium chelatase ChlI-like catalytic domain-containing protein n=1 Tax=Novipirellula caenicola TaxID=1536901 RepID=A0ABP9VWU6_9BACT